MRVGIVAGSFDPVTNGHVWVVRQAVALMDRLHVVVGVNPAKKPLFSADERQELLERTLLEELGEETFSRVKIGRLENELLINYATSVGAGFIVRGIRNAEDFSYEAQLRMVNRKINPSVESVFLIPPVELSEVSSSTVKGLVGFSGWERVVGQYVSPVVLDALKRVSLQS